MNGTFYIRPMLLRIMVTVALASFGFVSNTAAQTGCSTKPLMLQVLGSGGPFAAGNRASSGYLIWRDGRPIVMIDAGGGTYLRFAEAGARLADLSLLAISHLHPDHVADLPALLWQSDRLRKQALKVAGPSGAGPFPPMDAFIRRLFDSTGAFPILGGTLGQRGGGVRLEVVAVDVNASSPTRVLLDGDLEVTALGVPHGDVPSLAYRVRIGDRSVVLGSDQNGRNPRFIQFAAGADVLVLHLAVTHAASDALALRHAKPTVVGEVAGAIGPKRLVLSHLIEAPPPVESDQYSLADLGRAVAEVKSAFQGPVVTASDLQCIPIGLDLKTENLRKLGGPEAKPSSPMFAKFSGDRRRVAYVRENNIYVESLDDGRVTPLTTDGSRTSINGTFDWVYEEELQMRDGFRWSPNGKSIAYWQLDGRLFSQEKSWDGCLTRDPSRCWEHSV